MTATLCGFCKEPLGNGAPLIEGMELLHQECGMRLVIGSVAHLERRCSCYVSGSHADDPPHLTLRQAARAACLLYGLMQERN